MATVDDSQEDVRTEAYFPHGSSPGTGSGGGAGRKAQVSHDWPISCNFILFR